MGGLWHVTLFLLSCIFRTRAGYKHAAPAPSYGRPCVLWRTKSARHHRVHDPGRDGDDDNSLSVRATFPDEPRPGRLASRAKAHSKARNKQIGQPYWTESVCLRATIKDFAKARGQRPQNRGSVRTSIACRHVAMCLGAWSSGMIRASGARGRGFDSRSSPSHVAHVAARAAGQSRDDAAKPPLGQVQSTIMNKERALTWKKMRAQQSRRKKARMRTALEVIRRLEWDPACCADAVVVGYRDLGEIVERPLDAFSHWGAIELADEDELAIPQHRVVYFKSGDAIVWDKRRIYDVDGMPPRRRVREHGTRQGRPVGDRGAAARVAAQSRMIDPARNDDRTPPSPDDGAARPPTCGPRPTAVYDPGAPSVHRVAGRCGRPWRPTNF